MLRLGTRYGGWIIPKNNTLDENSIIYSGGVGEDISFDLILSNKYNSNIVLIDPTARAVKHFSEVNEYYKTGQFKFSGDIQKDYEQNIKNLKPNFNKIKYNNIGLWNEKTSLKFYKPKNKKFVSHSFINGMSSNNYDIVKVNTIKNIMEECDHDKIDLLKIDIEGAEYKVLNNILDDKIFPKYLCIEFDLFIKGKDKNNNTKKIIERLKKNGYKIFANENMNITFIRT